MNWTSYKPYYSRSLEAHRGYLHLCAHSHHLWLDATREAQLRAWDDACALSDRKWDYVLGTLIPKLQNKLATHLGINRGSRITFANNTHELFYRLLSGLKSSRKLRILSTDSEFHSFRRQAQILQEKDQIELELVPQFPLETLDERLLNAAKSFRADLIFVSHVFFNSGHVLPNDLYLLKLLKQQTKHLVLDVYHSFFARPVDFSELADDLYILGGSYKYLQAGEGACFLYSPPSSDSVKPEYSGWYSHFASLSAPQEGEVQYGQDAWRFWGSTFDPSALYRLEAVLDFFEKQSLTILDSHRRSLELQETFLQVLETNSLAAPLEVLKKSRHFIPPKGSRGNFLSFPLEPGEASVLQKYLASRNILTDCRESQKQSFLRLGFGLYHDPGDLLQLDLKNADTGHL